MTIQCICFHICFVQTGIRPLVYVNVGVMDVLQAGNIMEDNITLANTW